MSITQQDRELGTAYALRPSAIRTELTAVVRGTPMGELLRRYWHPVGLISDATDIPRKVRCSRTWCSSATGVAAPARARALLHQATARCLTGGRKPPLPLLWVVDARRSA